MDRRKPAKNPTSQFQTTKWWLPEGKGGGEKMKRLKAGEGRRLNFTAEQTDVLL